MATINTSSTPLVKPMEFPPPSNKAEQLIVLPPSPTLKVPNLKLGTANNRKLEIEGKVISPPAPEKDPWNPKIPGTVPIFPRPIPPPPPLDPEEEEEEKEAREEKHKKARKQPILCAIL